MFPSQIVGIYRFLGAQGIVNYSWDISKRQFDMEQLPPWDLTEGFFFNRMTEILCPDVSLEGPHNKDTVI